MNSMVKKPQANDQKLGSLIAVFHDKIDEDEVNELLEILVSYFPQNDCDFVGLTFFYVNLTQSN